MGVGDLPQGAAGPGPVLRGHRPLHQLDAARVAHGGGGAGRRGARHRAVGRGVLAVQGRGHPGHGDRLPHDPRLLALRHGRRVRQDPGEHAQGVGGRAHDLHRDGQPLHEPGADALDQHLAHRSSAGAEHPGRRGLDHGRHHARGVRSGPAGRAPVRRLLLDLHRHPDRGHPQGAGAAVPPGPRASWPAGPARWRPPAGPPPLPWPPTPRPTRRAEPPNRFPAGRRRPPPALPRPQPRRRRRRRRRRQGGRSGARPLPPGYTASHPPRPRKKGRR